MTIKGKINQLVPGLFENFQIDPLTLKSCNWVLELIISFLLGLCARVLLKLNGIFLSKLIIPNSSGIY